VTAEWAMLAIGKEKRGREIEEKRGRARKTHFHIAST
jgi:hypothetical protein